MGGIQNQVGMQGTMGNRNANDDDDEDSSSSSDDSGKFNRIQRQSFMVTETDNF